jgi:DNA mismatch repair protein MutS
MFVSNEVNIEVPQHPIVAELESIQPDDLTPKQALELLYQLKAKL